MTDTVILGRRAATPRQGFSPDSRVLAFVASTETPCPAYRADGFDIVEVQEILVASGCQNVGSLGGPLLNSHDRSSLSMVLGKLQSGKVDGAEILCTALMSQREDVKAFYPDLQDGIIDSVSVGYTCLREEWDRETSPITVRVTGWTIDEVSIVPIPADKSAKIRRERAAAAAAPRPEATMTPDALDAAFKAFGDSFTSALGGFRSALATSAAAPAAPVVVATPAAPVVAAQPVAEAAPAQRSAPPAAAAAPAAGARAEDEGDDSEGDGDGTGGDGEERKRKRAAMLTDLRLAMAGHRSEQFEALVRQGAPAAAIRRAAFAGVSAAPAKREVLTPPAGAVAGGAASGKRDSFIPFSERAKRPPAKVR